MSVSRVYDDPYMNDPTGVLAEITVTGRIIFSDEDAYNLVSGSILDPKKHSEQYDLIKARNILADTFIENMGYKVLSITIDKKTVEECAKLLEIEVPEKAEFHDVEVKL